MAVRTTFNYNSDTEASLGQSATQHRLDPLKLKHVNVIRSDTLKVDVEWALHEVLGDALNGSIECVMHIQMPTVLSLHGMKNEICSLETLSFDVLNKVTKCCDE